MSKKKKVTSPAPAASTTSRIHLFNEDCLEALRKMPDNSVDALVTDPPAGIAFMGKDWDKDKGGSKEWIAWMEEVMRECLRVLKPGAHGLVWALPRTSHWTAMAIEWAGFEIRDCIYHLFGQGFPKSLDVSKAIDKAAGLERRKVRRLDAPLGARGGTETVGGGWQDEPWETAASSPAAAKWVGWGTALKPAVECWWLIQKPMVGTVADNVLEHGVGALNIDESRIGHAGGPARVLTGGVSGMFKLGAGYPVEIDKGRFPANLILTDGEAVEMLDAQSGNLKTSSGPTARAGIGFKGGKGGKTKAPRPANEGGASRFFYCAKISPGERNAGLDDFEKKIINEACPPGSKGAKSPRAGAGAGRGQAQANTHPTVKPQKLMTYLIRLITPPGGRVLDVFMGSGSTGLAAVRLGHEFVGVERDPEYFKIAEARINSTLR